MFNVRSIMWELFLEKKNTKELNVRIGFSNEKPRLGDNYELTIGFLDKDKVKTLKMQTAVVREVHKINEMFTQVKTKYSYFIVSKNPEVPIEISKVSPIAGETVDEIVYKKDAVYICKKNNKYVYVLMY